MSATFLRMSLCGVVIAGLAGCGGGSNSGGNGGGGGNPTTVTYTFTGSTMPTAVATQIGTGAYTQASLSGDTLTVNVPSGETKYSVAFVCPAIPDTVGTSISSFTPEFVLQASTQDSTSFSLPSCSKPPVLGASGTFTGTVDASAIPAANSIESCLRNECTWWAISNGSASFSVAGPTGNSNDLVLIAQDALQNILAVKILRNLTIPGTVNNGNQVVMHVSDEVTTASIVVSNSPSGRAAILPSVRFFTANGSVAPLLSASSSTQYPVLPSAAFQSGDYYSFNASSIAGTLVGSNPPTNIIGVNTNNTSGGSVALALPSVWAYDGPTAAALPTFNFDYSGFSGKSGVVQSALIQWRQDSANVSRIEVSATANYQSGSTSITIPDLSTLTGFLSAAQSGTAVTWNASIDQSDYPAFELIPANGTHTYVEDSGTYTEP